MVSRSFQLLVGPASRNLPMNFHDSHADLRGGTEGKNEEIARALLGTNNGNGVYYLLAQHQRELPGKTVEKVQYWGTGPADRHMLFYIVNSVASGTS